MNRKLDDKWGIPVVAVEQIEALSKNILDNRIDCVGVLVGGERMGKSTLETLYALCFAAHLQTELKIARDYHFDLIRFVEDLLKTRFDNNALFPKKGATHYVKVYDEPVLGVNARKWQTEGNIMLNQTLATIGFKYYTILMGIPNFFMLDNMVREHRIAFLLRVYGKVNDDTGLIDKGYYSIYNGSDARKIYRDEKTGQIVYPSTKYKDLRFAGLEGTPVWAEYEEFSAGGKQAVNEALVKRAKDLVNGYVSRKPKREQVIDEIMSVKVT